MAEEDDYMSDLFIQNSTTNESCLNTQRNLVRKRKLEKHTIDSNLKNKIKPKRVLEKEQREKGLATSISGNNLGFQLMQKMGYKEGEGLGKKSEGRFEPIPIQVKANRFGLGKESSDKAKLNIRKELRKIVAEKKLKLESLLRNDFRARMRQKYVNQQTERDLRKSQNVCSQLDLAEEIKEPLYNFFWPSHMFPDPEEEEDKEEEEEEKDDEYSPDDRLAMITSYLRRQYCYCIWCASQFNDMEDMIDNCPGDTSNAHDE